MEPEWCVCACVHTQGQHQPHPCIKPWWVLVLSQHGKTVSPVPASAGLHWVSLKEAWMKTSTNHVFASLCPLHSLWDNPCNKMLRCNRPQMCLQVTELIKFSIKIRFERLFYINWTNKRTNSPIICVGLGPRTSLKQCRGQTSCHQTLPSALTPLGSWPHHICLHHPVSVIALMWLSPCAAGPSPGTHTP